MDILPALETLFDKEYGNELSLPAELATLYGQLHFPSQPGRPHIIGNFVSTLDGVVTLAMPGHEGGGDISGFNQQDAMVMGILRAVADAIIVGAGTLKASPGHRWSAEYIYPPLASQYQQLRLGLGKTVPPLNVIVTSQGNVDLYEPLFQTGEVPSLIVTTTQGEARILQQTIPPGVNIRAVQESGHMQVEAILEAVKSIVQSNIILIEGGPHLLGNFFAGQRLNELFMTLAPQIAGRDETLARPGLVAGQRFAPEYAVWGELISVKRGGNHLFLRYGFETVKGI